MLALVRLWILLSTLLVSAGWILSALHQLNRAGYVLFFAVALVLVLAGRRTFFPPARIDFSSLRGKFLQRFRRRAPQLFLLIALFSFLGGCLYPPLNFDANAYRLPRVMHWLWAEHWHWIHAFDARMNVAACGMEWLSAPLLLFSHSDRLLFLINCVSYLLLPGLIFSVLTRLQVPGRAAWWWTWLLSTGLCFALQAGSVGNDSFAAVYILAAVDLALRARQTQSLSDLCLSLLAAALVTGTKQSNIPLFALWLLAAWPARALFRQHLPQSILVLAFGALVSAVPISLLNYRHTGSWLPLEVPGIATLGHFQLNPFWGIVGNLFCLPVQNLVPPFYSLMPPLHSYWPVLWNEWMRHFVQTSFGSHFGSFESFGFLTEAYYRGVSEANAGIGLGICLLLFAAYRTRRQLRKRGLLVSRALEPDKLARWLRLAPWGLLLIFMAKNGAFENARQLAPYYPFLMVVWLVRPGHSQVTRDPAWRQLALAVMVVSALLVATAVERPLFPARTMFRWVQAKFPGSDFLSDECIHYLASSYHVALARRDYLDRKLPPDEKVIGYYHKMFSDDEPGLWLPYGRRRVECLLPDDPPDRLGSLGIRYVVVDGATARNTDGSIEKWLARYHATLVDQYTFPKPASVPAEPPGLYLVRLN